MRFWKTGAPGPRSALATTRYVQPCVFARTHHAHACLDAQSKVKAGYVIQYGGSNVTEFYYLTVNGAGHMVPQVCVSMLGMCMW